MKLADPFPTETQLAANLRETDCPVAIKIIMTLEDEPGAIRQRPQPGLDAGSAFFCGGTVLWALARGLCEVREQWLPFRP